MKTYSRLILFTALIFAGNIAFISSSEAGIRIKPKQTCGDCNGSCAGWCNDCTGCAKQIASPSDCIGSTAGGCFKPVTGIVPVAKPTSAPAPTAPLTPKK